MKLKKFKTDNQRLLHKAADKEMLLKMNYLLTKTNKGKNPAHI